MKLELIEKLPQLGAGPHDEGSGELCAMEMVACMERLPHSDMPSCTCPAIALYVQSANDDMSYKDRSLLLPYLPRLVGTVSPEHMGARVKAVIRYVVNEVLPMRPIPNPQQCIAAKTMKDCWAAARVVWRDASHFDLSDAGRTSLLAAEEADSSLTGESIAADHTDETFAAYYAASAIAQATENDAESLLKGLDIMLSIGPQSTKDFDPVRVQECIEEFTGA